MGAFKGHEYQGVRWQHTMDLGLRSGPSAGLFDAEFGLLYNVLYWVVDEHARICANAVLSSCSFCLSQLMAHVGLTGQGGCRCKASGGYGGI